MRYKAILMDADQTILDFNAAEKNAISRLFARHGLTHPDAYDRYHEINIACWEAYERGELTLEELKYERFARLTAIYLPAADVKAMAEEYEDFLSEQGDLIPHADEMLREISAALPIVIVTNGTRQVQEKRLRLSPIRDYVKSVVISEEVGFAKPDPRILSISLSRAGLTDPKDALMIGDSLTSDMRAALGAGMDFLWYNPGGKPCPPDAHITYEARDVCQFAAIALQ